MFNDAEPVHTYLDDMIITHYIRQGLLEESIWYIGGKYRVYWKKV
jgi:hypothetical protein